MNQLTQNPSQPWHYQPTINYMREQMFEKPLTPSDVGKLNRLVIPKQHAEKYFPLDSESVEKGLLLCFEDELGKLWKFRYSYWTSSQSYVITKGWSRFVKEKRLDAGDVIVFHQCDDRLFIGCSRRSTNDAAANRAEDVVRINGDLPWSPSFYAASTSPYPTPPYYMNSGEHAGSSAGSRETLAATGNSRRLRLFGVNLECGPDQSEPQHFGSGSWRNQFLSTNASTSQL